MDSKHFGNSTRGFNPIGETYAFDKLTILMHQPRCKNMSELPGTVEKWEANVRQYEDRSGDKFPESMKMLILMQMIPAKDLEQVLYRFRMNPEKDYANFSKQLVEFGTERRYEAMRGNGAAPMDLDMADHDGTGKTNHRPSSEYRPVEEYTAEQWRDWYASGMPGEAEEQDQSADWLSKGGKVKGKGKKGGKTGKGKGSASGCLWCGKGDHYKKDCREF